MEKEKEIKKQKVIYFSEEIERCKELVRPLYEKYCSEFMDLIEEIQAQE